MNKEDVLVLMHKKWDTPEKKKMLQGKYAVSDSYISYLFSGAKPPSYWILTELGLKKERVMTYVPV